MAADKGEKIQVKKIASSDLTAEEISKAIEATAASSAKKSIAISVDSGTDEVKVATTSKAPQVEPKTDDSPDAPADDVRIVVKRRGGFVQPPTPMGQRTDESTTAKESRASTIDLPIKPPSETQRVVAVPASEEVADEAPQPALTEEKAQSTKAEKTTQPAAEPPTPEPQAAASIGAPKLPDVGKNDDDQSDSDALLQNPTVFDTTQYHLPIRAKSHHYVNSIVAWVVLILVLVGAAGYVLSELDVIKLSDLNLL